MTPPNNIRAAAHESANTPRGSGFGIRLAAVLVALAGFIAGITACSSPQERYKTLSFFFDGVPNPDAAKNAVAQTQEAGPTVITASIVSRHKPYMEGKCDACHHSATGDILEFEQAYHACLNCHKGVPTMLPRMHGPVARGECNWCHTGHESNEAALLKDTPIKVCTQCHDSQLLGPKPPEHVDGHTSCLLCHYGHGGNAADFLKPAAGPPPATWPGSGAATAPASQPGGPSATQPATQPASAPVLHLPGGPGSGNNPPPTSDLPAGTHP